MFCSIIAASLEQKGKHKIRLDICIKLSVILYSPLLLNRETKVICLYHTTVNFVALCTCMSCTFIPAESCQDVANFYKVLDCLLLVFLQIIFKNSVFRKPVSSDRG